MYSLLYWLPFPGDAIWRLCGDICFVSVVCLPWQLFLAPVFRFSLNCFQQGLMAFLSAVSSSLLDLMALKIFYSLFFIALRDFSSLWVFPVWSIFRCVSRLWQSICRVALALILFFSARYKIVFSWFSLPYCFIDGTDDYSLLCMIFRLFISWLKQPAIAVYTSFY